MATRYTILNTTECHHEPTSQFEMGFAVRATSYKVAGKHNDYVVVRAHGHFYDDDSDMFLTCRGLLFKSDKTLRLEEASEGTMSSFCRNEQIWFNSEMMRALQGQHSFFDSCGEMAINALEITLKRLDGVEHVKWGLFPSDTPTTYEFLDATDHNAFHQMLEKEHLATKVTCGGIAITCGNYEQFM
jgi:hypothetical protein